MLRLKLSLHDDDNNRNEGSHHSTKKDDDPVSVVSSVTTTTTTTNNATTENNNNKNDMNKNNCPYEHLFELLRPGGVVSSSGKNNNNSNNAAAVVNVDRMSTTDLAYLGDVIYEFAIRSWMVWPPKRTSDLQTQVVNLVRAEYQSHLLQRLKQQVQRTDDQATKTGRNAAAPLFVLTAREDQILMRGRNSAARVSSGRRAVGRKNPAAYQDATAFEALLGWLYVTDSERCCDLLRWIRHAVLEGGGE